jgi:hypothetical protein
MDEPARKTLLLHLRIALGMLPRYIRQDFWRTTEPQHQRAVDAIAEHLTKTVDEHFEVQAKPRKPIRSSTL